MVQIKPSEVKPYRTSNLGVACHARQAPAPIILEQVANPSTQASPQCWAYFLIGDVRHCVFDGLRVKIPKGFKTRKGEVFLTLGVG